MKFGPFVFSISPEQLPWPEVKYKNDGPDWRYLWFALSNMNDFVVAFTLDFSTAAGTWQRRAMNRFDAAWELLTWPLAPPGRRAAKHALRHGTCTQCLDMTADCGRCKPDDSVTKNPRGARRIWAHCSNCGADVRNGENLYDTDKGDGICFKCKTGRDPLAQ